MPKRHPLLISRRREYLPWDRINWIKEALSNDGKDFIIPEDLLKPVYIKIKERYGKPCKPVYVTKPASPRWQPIYRFLIPRFTLHSFI